MNSGELDRARAYAATLRTQIHEELDRTLSRDPAFLIVDRRPRMAAKLEQLLRRSGRAADELAIHRAAGEVEALALAATDMWLVSVALEPFGDEVELVQRLRVRYPHAVLLGYGDHPWSRPGALFVAGMELLFDHAELETELPAAAAVVRRRRRTLREGLLHRELSRRVTEKHGPEVARHLGLIPPPPREKVLSITDALRLTVSAALAETGGNKTKAAAHLGVTRQTLHSWLRSWASDDDP